MATERKELRTDLRITGEASVKRGLKDVGDAAHRAGDEFDELGKDAGFLGKQVEETQTKIKGLIATLNETGDVDLLKAIKKEKRQLRLFEGLHKDLQKELQAELDAAAAAVAQPGGGGDAIGDAIAQGISVSLKFSKPQIIGAVAGVGAALAPFLGGVIASAVLGGVGVGGIAGGIALAAKDTRVEAAAQDLAGTAAVAFESAAEPFVVATVDSLHTLERAAQDVAGGIGQGFRTIAPVMKPLTDGVIGLVNEALPGLLKGFEAAKPVIRVIANELPDIGAALGDMIGIIAEDTDGAIMAFENLSDIIQVTLRGTGILINNLTRMYASTVDAASAITGVLEEVYKWVSVVFPVAGLLSDLFGGTHDWAEDLKAGLDKAGDASGDLSDNISDVADEAENAEVQLRAMKDASNDLFDITMGLDEATTAYKQSIADMREDLQGVKKTLDDNTQAGRDNLDTIRDRIKKIEGMRDAEAESTLGLEEANKRYAERLEALKRDLIQMGFNKKAIEAMLAPYANVPKAIEVKVNLTTGGSAAAWSALRNLERQGLQLAAKSSPGGFEERAGGGPTRAGRSYLVGENGPEIWSENANGFITPAPQTAALMSGASGGSRMSSGAAMAPQSTGDLGMDALIDFLWPAIQKRYRINNGFE